ncbi:hypothetical protein PHYPSEUDO_002793 [Phytophthora pseudosyringae]|uniref:RxLR effector protein n=1 Tax=Phytophthora pseudosyringae TaxID=221518 RepID=A0A8T1VVR4_9STRA|nr:hypothetical protein PHYPSEUDO_002793 [Phytophthora pseudosyringae]
MRPHSLVLLAVATLLLLIADSSCVSANRDSVNLSVRISAIHSAKSSRKLLRASDGDDESRTVSLPALEAPVKAGMSKATRVKIWWWVRQKKSSDNVLGLLRLGDGVEGLLSNPQLSTLEFYVSKFNAKYPKSPVTMVEALSSKYGNVKVAKMLEMGKKSASTKTWATKLEAEQLRVWQDKKLSPVEVYTLLKLDDTTTSPFGSLVLETWIGYLNKFNTQKNVVPTDMLKALQTVYGERGLASLLYASRELPDPKKLAEKLQLQQFAYWFKDGINRDNFYRYALGLKPGSKASEMDKKILAEYAVFSAKQPKTSW